MNLSRLSEYHADGDLTDEDLLSLPEYRDLDSEARDVLLDLVVADNGYAPKEVGGEDLADYATRAYTGYESLTEWADEEMRDNLGDVRPGESVDHYAASALLNEIWTLPKRDCSGDYRVMWRAEAL